ncbi:MAG: hypothetical protein ACETWC_08660 [Acidobacteriota bacterium]
MMKRLIVAFTLVLFVSSFLCADVYVKTVQRTEAYEMMGKRRPENVEIVEMWLAKNKYAQIGKSISIIIDYEKEKLYFIVHPQKIYFELPTDTDLARLQELLPPKYAQIISSITVTDAKVNLTGQTKKVANWDCYAVEFEMVFMVPALNMMPKFKIRMWLTENVPFNYEAYTSQSEFFERFVFGILNVDDNSKKELEKLDTVDGFQVSTEVTFSIFGSEIKAEAQCLEVAERPAPAGVYSVPKDYKPQYYHTTIEIRKKVLPRFVFLFEKPKFLFLFEKPKFVFLFEKPKKVLPKIEIQKKQSPSAEAIHFNPTLK